MTPNDPSESSMTPYPTHEAWQDLREEIRESFKLLNQRFDTLSQGHSLHGQHIAVLQAQHAAVLHSQNQCRVECQSMQNSSRANFDQIKQEVNKLELGQAVTGRTLALVASIAGGSVWIMQFVATKVWP